MKGTYLLTLLMLSIFIAGCSLISGSPTGQVVKETIEETTEGELVEPEEVEEVIYDPLGIKLTSDKNKGELSLKAKLTCDGTGGKEPYSYEWRGAECEGDECLVSFNELGEYEVTCTITDDKGDEAESLQILEVTKIINRIDSIYVLGDSLSYGESLEKPTKDNWAHLYVDDLIDADIDNYAVTGATSRDVIQKQIPKLQDEISENENNIIFLWVGANDMVQLSSHESYRVNMERIVKEIIDYENTQVVLLNVPDATKLAIADALEDDVNKILGEFGFTIELKELSADYIKSFNSIIDELGSEYEIPVIDMFSFMEKVPEKYISDDFFHPNERGHEEINDHVQSELEKIYPDTEFR